MVTLLQSDVQVCLQQNINIICTCHTYVPVVFSSILKDKYNFGEQNVPTYVPTYTIGHIEVLDSFLLFLISCLLFQYN